MSIIWRRRTRSDAVYGFGLRAIGRYHMSGNADTSPSFRSGIAFETKVLHRGTVPAAKSLHGFLHLFPRCMHSTNRNRTSIPLHIVVVHRGMLLKQKIFRETFHLLDYQQP